jgi:hypothetical protein
MKRNHRLVAAAVLASGFAFGTAAAADCAAELESMGVSKDGSTAPLAGGATPQTGGMMAAGGDDAEQEAGKTGSMMPMGESADVATSAEDAQAQSQGGETAAAQAMGDAEGGEGGGDARQMALDEARAALAAGDEEACMAAIEKAKGM